MRFIDITGKKYGDWTVIKRNKDMGPRTYWICECVCGSIRNVEAGRLKAGGSLRCKACATRNRLTTHGKSNHLIYGVWLGIKKRCYNQNEDMYHRYGGRGITVCGEWMASFENFLKDMGDGYRKGLQIDRIDNDGNYEPSNCRWITPINNIRNSTIARLNLSDVKDIKLKISLGVNQSELARKYGISRSTICDIKYQRTWGDV